MQRSFWCAFVRLVVTRKASDDIAWLSLLLVRFNESWQKGTTTKVTKSHKGAYAAFLLVRLRAPCGYIGSSGNGTTT